MPISKVPIVHKFGIISLSKAEQQVRKESLKRQTKTHKTSNKSTSCPVITLDFISKYNSSSEKRKEELNGIIKRVLEHAKYKSTSSTTALPDDDPDVSEGWLELIMLCQCYGPLQEECLTVLAMSLFCSPLSPSHVPALFYISGLCYHWLKSENISSTILRLGELQLLKVLYGVSLRLYNHHLTGALQNLCSKHEILQLKFDLEGFECCEKMYANFPEALLQWRVSLEVGQLICEKYERQTSQVTPVSPTNTTSTNCTKSSFTNSSHGGHDVSSILWHALDIWQCVQQGCDSLTEAVQDLVSCSTDFNTQQWLEGLLAMNILCYTARLNIDVLQFLLKLASNGMEHQGMTCTTSTTSNDITNHRSLSPSSDQEKYTTSYECRDVPTINLLGVQPKFKLEEEEGKEENDEEDNDDDESISGNTSHTSVNTQALIDTESIPDILPSNTDTNSPQIISTTLTLDSLELKNSSTAENLSRPFDDAALTSSEISTDTTTKKNPTSNKRVTLVTAANSHVNSDSEDIASTDGDTASSTINRVGLLDDRFELIEKKGGATKSVTLIIPPPRDTDSHCTHYTHSTAPFSCGAGVLGSQAAPSTVYQQSILSLPSTISKDESLIMSPSFQHMHNFDTWPSDVRLAYTLNLSDVVIYGKDSNISRMALVGQDEVHKRYCLSELAAYNDLQFGLKSFDDAENWKVRHCALLGLSLVVEHCSKDRTRDGFSSVAWSVLLARERTEQNSKVSEARKLQNVSTSPKKPLSPRPLTTVPCPLVPTLFGSIAQQLSQLYLPPLTAAVNTKPLKPKTKALPINKPMPLKVTGTPKVDTGRTKVQEISQPIGYIARTGIELNKIAEKHWMLQMESEAEEEKEMMNKLEKEKELEEEKKLERKKEKLSKNRRPATDSNKQESGHPFDLI